MLSGEDDYMNFSLVLQRLTMILGGIQIILPYLHLIQLIVLVAI